MRPAAGPGQRRWPAAAGTGQEQGNGGASTGDSSEEGAQTNPEMRRSACAAGAQGQSGLGGQSLVGGRAEPTLGCAWPHRAEQPSVGSALQAARCGGYFRLPSIQSTVAWICSSVRAGCHPGRHDAAIRAGIALDGVLVERVLPCAMRLSQCEWSSVGAMPTPVVWQAVHRLSKITLPFWCRRKPPAKQPWPARRLAAACAAAPVLPA